MYVYSYIWPVVYAISYIRDLFRFTIDIYLIDLIEIYSVDLSTSVSPNIYVLTTFIVHTLLDENKKGGQISIKKKWPKI